MDLGRHRWGMDLFYIAWICLTCLNKSSPSSIETVCECTGPLELFGLTMKICLQSYTV